MTTAADRPVTVVDTNVLVNLVTPVVDARPAAPSGGDPLRALLVACEVHVPAVVLGEVTEIAADDDLLATAATAVLRAADHIEIHDVPEGDDETSSFGLDPVETAAIRLANELAADVFVTDEFGTTTLPLVLLQLADRNTWYTTPHVLCALADRDFLDADYTNAALAYLRRHKGWDRTFVDRLRAKYGLDDGSR